MSSTIVTCYYKTKSKHSYQKYDEWITNFLPNIHCDLVIFTSPDLKDYLLEKRKGNLREKTFLVCKEFNDLYVCQNYSHKWNYQYSIDESLHCGRTKECYIIWNSKLWFLKIAIDINPFQSDKFVWADIGSIRDEYTPTYLHDFPNYHLISNDKLDIILLNPITNKNQYYFMNEVHFSGALFGSHKNVILQVYDLFYQRFDEFINKDYFIGCDQQTFSSIYNTNPELFNVIEPTLFIPKLKYRDKEFTQLMDEYCIHDKFYFLLWFYYLYY
jgi:hypothetical protein